VVGKVSLDHLVVELGNGEEGLNVLLLLRLWSEQDGSSLSKNIGVGVDNLIGVAGHLPVLRVIVAKLDAEHAEDGAHLRELVLFAVDSDAGLGKSTAKFATLASSFFGSPAFRSLRGLVLRLTVILEELHERITTTAHAEVVPLDGLVEDSLALLDTATTTGGSVGGWLSGFSA